jgi:hypothetical protein
MARTLELRGRRGHDGPRPPRRALFRHHGQSLPFLDSPASISRISSLILDSSKLHNV